MWQQLACRSSLQCLNITAQQQAYAGWKVNVTPPRFCVGFLSWEKRLLLSAALFAVHVPYAEYYAYSAASVANVGPMHLIALEVSIVSPQCQGHKSVLGISL